MNQLPSSAHDLITALYNNPACLFILVGLNLLGVMLQQTPIVPHRFNFLIPWLLFGLGILFVVMLVPVTLFPAGQPHPKLLLGIIGFCFGVAAWMIHEWPVQWVTRALSAKFGNPAPEPPKP